MRAVSQEGIGGCVAGVVATVWTGPGAAVGCLAGFVTGGVGGAVTGTLLTMVTARTGQLDRRSSGHDENQGYSAD